MTTDFKWVENYLGIPWVGGGRVKSSGLDCWGLLRVVLAEQRGINLPEYANLNLENVQGIRDLMKENTSERWVRFDAPRPFDAVTIGSDDHPHHVGIYLMDSHVLHTTKDFGSHVTTLSRLAQKYNNVALFYRYND